MRRRRRSLRDETGAARPPVYLTGFRARRRPRRLWPAAVGLVLLAVVAALLGRA